MNSVDFRYVGLIAIRTAVASVVGVLLMALGFGFSLTATLASIGLVPVATTIVATLLAVNILDHEDENQTGSDAGSTPRHVGHA